MKNILKNKSITQFIKFGMVGVINTLVDYIASFIFLNLIFHDQYIAQVFGFSAGIINSYILNKKWTFKDADGGGGKFIKFVIVGIVGMLSSLLIFWLLRWISTGNTNFDFLIKKIATTIIVTIINFFGSKIFVFND